LYDALEFPIPKFVTLPPILREDKTKKLGKRDGAKDILEYRAEGYLPSALMNFLALTGWNPGTDTEIFTKEELTVAFDISGIQSGGALLNEEKMKWINREHLLRLPLEDFAKFAHSWLPEETQTLRQYSDERFAKLVPELRERVSIGKDIADQCGEGEYDFAFQAPHVDPSMIAWKNDATPRDAVPRLQKLAEIVATITENAPVEEIKNAIWDYAVEIGKGEVLWPLRVALTGKERSPDPFMVIHIIGSAEAYNRIKNACDTILRAT
jgi:glutamyl/glutaminyl-tRNA synthetase